LLGTSSKRLRGSAPSGSFPFWDRPPGREFPLIGQSVAAPSERLGSAFVKRMRRLDACSGEHNLHCTLRASAAINGGFSTGWLDISRTVRAHLGRGRRVNQALLQAARQQSRRAAARPGGGLIARSARSAISPVQIRTAA
jgi:hypothetical protein